MKPQILKNWDKSNHNSIPNLRKEGRLDNIVDVALVTDVFRKNERNRTKHIVYIRYNLHQGQVIIIHVLYQKRNTK